MNFPVYPQLAGELSRIDGSQPNRLARLRSPKRFRYAPPATQARNATTAVDPSSTWYLPRR
jgi:hypothetical protein